MHFLCRLAQMMFMLPFFALMAEEGAKINPRALHLDVTSAGKKYIYEVTYEQCGITTWDGEGEPPLSLGAALVIARKGLVEIYKEDRNRVLNRISIIPIGDSGKWIYLMEYGQPKGVSAGWWSPLPVLVTFDGSVVKPSKVEQINP